MEFYERPRSLASANLTRLSLLDRYLSFKGE